MQAIAIKHIFSDCVLAPHLNFGVFITKRFGKNFVGKIYEKMLDKKQALVIKYNVRVIRF